ncbi:hypothetical protein UCREL1_11004 [Eutypa lata UCREL1]|uniref:Extracellular serine-threonine rich protein n=1 Tax=Eutypa lata (strain UCR-EL1) TaxID=1287681 RepID=M7SD09_EUTLA|nr:hypothetical protein UCREL1_11004 [Eutypa lata UCREL1]
MFIKQVVTLALASSALAQMTDMSGMGHTTTPAETAAESEETSQTPLMTDYPSGFTNSTASTAMMTDTAVPTSMVDSTVPPASYGAPSEMTSMPTMSTSVVPDTAMPHGTGGAMPMPMPNSTTGTGTPEPPISGSGVNGVSVALFAASVVVAAFFHL